MDGKARAGIDIYGTVLRYAEVEQRGGRYHLLRLGSCDFDFEVVGAVLDATTTEPLEAVTDALTDVFEGSTASRLHIALHPPDCYSFFSPLPVEVSREERKQRLLREAALLTRSRSPHPLRLTADPVYTEAPPGGGGIEWYHVLALRERLHVRFDRIFRMLPQGQYRMTLSMHAVAIAVERIERLAGRARDKAPFTLAFGWYPSHVEYTLCRHGRWYFSYYADAVAPEDSAYFALLLLDRLGVSPAAVGRLFHYGGHRDPEAFGAFRDAFTVVLEPLNPMQLIDLEKHTLAADQNLEAYAPCIGVTL